MGRKPNVKRAASPKALTISVEEAATLLGVGRNQAYEAARHGQIPSIRVGGRILIPRAALERLLSGEVPARQVRE